VETLTRPLELRLEDDGRVTVDMGVPVFDPVQIPFDPKGLVADAVSAPGTDGFALWKLDAGDQTVDVAVVSMGNPHAVQVVEDVESAPVASLGPVIETDPHFPNGVNAGFMQVVARTHIRLRVYERGAGETLACGTGACAAVVAGIRLGLLNRRVDVETRGGLLTIAWPADDAVVLMTGPASTVFQGEIEL
jgi:diaminopimelate epimerase